MSLSKIASRKVAPTAQFRNVFIKNACRSTAVAADAYAVPNASEAFVHKDYSQFKPSIITPKFWDYRSLADPANYQIDCAGYDMTEHPSKNSELTDKMKALYQRTGCVMLVKTGLNGHNHANAMNDWGRVLMPTVMEYEGGANSRQAITQNNVYETGAPLSAYLHYHHEMAYVQESTDRITFMALKAPEDAETPLRGASFLSENIGVTETLLKTEMGKKLKERGICYIRCLTNQDAYAEDQLTWKDIEKGRAVGQPVYNHWQTSFMTDDQAEAQRLAAQKGLYVEWGPNKYMKTKFYVSGFEYCEAIDKNVLYSSIADNGSWFDTWPGMEQLPDMDGYADANEGQKPLLITYGDNSLISKEELEIYTDAYDKHGFPVGGERGWCTGDIVTFCNYRYAHGRPGIELLPGQKREVGVILGPKFERQGCRPDKW